MKSKSSITLKMPPTVHALSNTPIFNMIRFWGRKPHNIVREYIQRYTEKGDIVLDPFSGCGVVAIESLKAHRRAIYNDLNLYCNLIGRVSCEPISINELNRNFDKLINNLKNKKYRVKAGNSEQVITFDWLYLTLCPYCSKPAELISVVFTKEYQINENKKFKFSSVRYKGKTLRVPINLLKNTNKLSKIAFEIYKVIKEYNKISHEDLKSKLKLDVRAEEITRSINKVLIDEEFISVTSDVPIEIEYACYNKNCSVTKGRKAPTADDVKKINRINKMSPPYHYPSLRLSYPSGEKFQTYRPGTENVDSLFTKRNLIALSILMNEIEQLNTNKAIKETFLLTFVAILEQVCKMQRPNKKGWAVKNYIIHPIFLEMNVLYTFKKRFNSIIEGKKEINKSINDFYKESLLPKEIINKKSNVCFLNMDATKLPINDNSVDYVFTDPEYGDSIQYYELSFMASSWLGFENDWKNEIVVNSKQEKTLETYRYLLMKAFKEIHRIIKANKYLTVTFHSKEIKYWNALMYAIQVAGFEYVTAVYQIPQKEYTNWLYARNPGEMSGDVYITFYKPEYKQVAQDSDIDINQIIQNFILPTIKEIILLHNGQATFNQLVRAITLHLISKGLMHHQKIREINYEKVFDKNFKRLGKTKIWRLKEPEKVSPVDFIPLDRRIEWIIFSVFNRKQRLRERVTISDILSAIFTTLKNSKTPENIEILKILRTEAEPKIEGKIPYWIPKSMKQLKLGFEKEKILLSELKITETLDHDRIIRAIANLGKIFGFDTWIGDPEVKKNHELKKYKSVEELTIPGIDSIVLNRLKNVDIIFLERKQIPICLIEVEHTTDIRSGLLRMANIFEVLKHLNVMTFTILPDKRVSKLKDILCEPSIQKLVGKRDVYYGTYSIIAELLDELEYRKLKFTDFINICEVLQN